MNDKDRFKLIIISFILFFIFNLNIFHTLFINIFQIVKISNDKLFKDTKQVEDVLLVNIISKISIGLNFNYSNKSLFDIQNKIDGLNNIKTNDSYKYTFALFFQSHFILIF